MASTPASLDPVQLDSGSTASIGGAPWLVLLAAFLGWMFDGLEQGIFPLIARPALRQMLHAPVHASAYPIITWLNHLGPKDVGGWLGAITAAWLIGAAAGGLIFGYLGDRIGRVRSMALSVLVYSAFTGVGYFAQHPWHLLILRFFAALGMGGEWSLGVALVMECWPNNRRPVLAGLIGLSANVGFAITGTLGLIFVVSEDSWRWVMLAGLSPAVLTLVIRIFVPESERWKHAVASGGPSRPLREVVSMPLLPRTLLGIALASIALIGTWGAVQLSIAPWVDKLAGPAHPHAKAMSLLLVAMGAIVGCWLGAVLAGRWGRRITYFGICLLSFVTCAVLFRCFHAYNAGMMVMMFLVGALTASFFGWLPLYLPELFPTRVRATGQGIAYNTGRILAAAGAVWGGHLVGKDENYARSAAIVTTVYLVGMVIIWFAPETMGKPLPE